MRLRSSLVAMALVATAPGPAHAAYPACSSRVPAARPVSMAAGEVSVHGYGGILDGRHGGRDGSAFAIPEVPGVTPRVRTGDGWSTDEHDVLFEADVVMTDLVLELPGYLAIGSDSTIVRPLGGLQGTTTTAAGAQRVSLDTFTGHYHIEKRQYSCLSLVRPNTLLDNRFYEFWLTGFLTPTAGGSPLRGYGQATGITLVAGDTHNH